MATLENITNKINTLRGDMNYRRVMEKGLDYLENGRRANHDFIVKTNMRTLRSGPNRGKIRVDGAVLVMFGNKDRSFVQTAIVRDGTALLGTLDRMAETLAVYSE
jgi:hypothetical protein